MYIYIYTLVQHIIQLLMEISYLMLCGGSSISQLVSLSFFGAAFFYKNHASLRDLLMFGAPGMVLGIWRGRDRPQPDRASN